MIRAGGHGHPPPEASMRSDLNFIATSGAIRLALFAVLSSSAAIPAAAIITRHDVPDAKYRDFGETYRGYIAQLDLPGRKEGSAPNLFNGMGTLIAPQWII